VARGCRLGALARGLAAAIVLTTAPTLAITVPGTDGRLAVGGFLDGLGIIDTGGGPDENPQGTGSLWMEGHATKWLHGFVQVTGQAGGPYVDGRFGVFNYVEAFQNYSPSLSFDQAYADVRLRALDVRLGIQRFSWGKLDGIAPTDVMNPRSLHDPFVVDLEEAKVAVPALRLSYYPQDVPRLQLSQLRTTLIYVPWAVPSRLPLIAERWFPPTTDLQRIDIPASSLPAVIRPFVDQDPFVIPVRLRVQNDAPPKTLGEGGVGLQLGGTWRSTDWGLYHYSGPATRPNSRFESVLVRVSPLPPPPLAVRSDVNLRQTTSRIHMTGFDLATVLGPATLRAEAALYRDQPYLRDSTELVQEAVAGLTPSETGAILRRLLGAAGRAPVALPDLFVRRDSVEWGIGVDYLFRGALGLLQLNQTALFESAPDLLAGDPATRLTALVRRSFLRDRLEAEVRGVYSITKGDWLLFPRVAYLLSDGLRARLGYLLIGGPRNALLGQYGDNDEVVLELRYTF
jgi:hypothetical protein